MEYPILAGDSAEDFISENERNRRQHIDNSLRNKGRKLITWWDGQPVHRPMTIAEKCERDGLDPAVVALGIALLSSPNYKPTFNPKS